MLTNTKSGLKGSTRSIPALPSPMQVVVYVARLVAIWERRARERRALGEMSEHMLKDLGISRVDARREAEKAFWRV